MKILIPCMTCLRELDTPFELFLRELQDNGCYKVECSNGHVSIAVSQEQKFEVLFSIAAHAIIDGYYREAVSSFASSLECFYEFCIMVLCESKSVDDRLIFDAWNKVSSHSERQLGAFIFLWTSELNKLPPLLSDTQKSFRNNVIHKGHIPSKEKTLEYGNTIMNDVKSMISLLKKLRPNEISTITIKHIKKAQSRIQKNPIPVSTFSQNSFLGLIRQNEVTLEEVLDALQKQKENLFSPYSTKSKKKRSDKSI